jgi:hypothetical protein
MVDGPTASVHSDGMGECNSHVFRIARARCLYDAHWEEIQRRGEVRRCEVGSRCTRQEGARSGTAGCRATRSRIAGFSASEGTWRRRVREVDIRNSYLRVVSKEKSMQTMQSLLGRLHNA